MDMDKAVTLAANLANAAREGILYSAKELRFVAALLDVAGCDGIGAKALEKLVRKARGES